MRYKSMMLKIRGNGVSMAGVVLFLVGAVAIGCGGGGGGGSTTGLTTATSSTATTSTATTSTATATTSTATTSTATTSTATTSTATTSTNGDVPGVLPKNVIFYDVYNENSEREFRYISPNGTGDTLFVTLPPRFDAFAPNPVKASEYYFAAHTSDTGKDGLYKNSSITLTGATQIVGPTYDTVTGMQISNDGRFLAYTAYIGEAETKLYVIDLQTPTAPPITVDSADFFHISPDVRKVVYSKPSGGPSDIFIRDFPAGAVATNLTNDATAEDFSPQFNKDSSRIVFTSDRDSTGAYDLWAIGADGKNITRVTDTPDDLEIGASWAPDGTQVAYGVATGVSGGQNGLFRKPLDGDRVLIKEIVGINQTRWTGSNGKSNTAGANIGLSAKKRKVEGP
ncbi:hypothetical protein BH11ARM2_BH11ARM2_06030 [soil metagenome]